jgi:hypothetical protein
VVWNKQKQFNALTLSIDSGALAGSVWRGGDSCF